jgi:N6-adenosine-specific RNA methylase IME4
MSLEELKEANPEPYQVIYADPPWAYSGWNLAEGDRKDYKKRLKTGDVQHHYEGMSNAEIAALPVRDLIDKDAACFMWTTDTHLPFAMEIMKSWGFTYKTIGFVWVKKTIHGKQVKMLAPWTNKGAELCLFGTRGSMIKHLVAKDVYQVHEAVRREHSRKPDIIRDEIARMFPDLKKLELFARQQYPGWDAWGNEVGKFNEEDNKPTTALW